MTAWTIILIGFTVLLAFGWFFFILEAKRVAINFNVKMQRLAKRLGCFDLEFHPGTGWAIKQGDRYYWSREKDACDRPIGFSDPELAVDLALEILKRKKMVDNLDSLYEELKNEGF